LNCKTKTNMINTTSSELLICKAYLSQIPTYQKLYFHQIAFGINTAFATSLNVLTCVVLYKSPSISIGNYYLILSLAISDLIVGMVISPAAAFSIANSCMLNKIGDFVSMLLAPTGITICAIAYDRHLRIKDKVISKTKRVVVTILIPWLSSLLLVVFKLVGELAYTAIIITLFIGAYMLLFVSYLQLIRSLHRVVRPASLSVKCDVVTTNAINENVTKDLTHVKCTQGDKDGNVNLEVRCNVVTDDAVIKKHRKVCKDVKSTHKDKNRNIMFHKNMKAIKFILGLICIFVFFSSGMFMFRCLTFLGLLYEDFAIKFKTY